MIKLGRVVLVIGFLVLGVSPVFAGSIASGTWQQGPSLTISRSYATATLLTDGRVVFAGGKDANGNPLASVEMFMPDGSIATGPSMSTPRYGHSAIVLGDGRLLVAGGRSTNGSVLSSAEIFDPTTNTWSPASGAMMDPRADFTMSNLENGDVLVAGGDRGSGPVSSVERFSQASGTFVYQTTLTAARMKHAASVLKDGRILFTGGVGVAASGSLTALTWTEIYDPSSNSVSAGSALNVARSAHTSTTLVDGTVLIAGGNDGSSDLASLEVYDPFSNTMTLSSASLATARSGHVALLLPNNGHVLIAGGSSAGTVLSSTELYRSWTGAAVANPTMTVARQGAAATALQTDGTAVVAGGSSLAATDLYGFATVKTDALDYAPGTPVNITGSGWVPGETVTLSLLESPYYDTPPQMTAIADAQGNIANSQFAPDSYDTNTRFYLTAKGSASQAQTTFTDAGAANLTITASPSAAVGGSFSISYTNNGGSPKNQTLTTPQTNLGTQAGSNFTISNIAAHNGCTWIESASGVSVSTTGGGSAVVNGATVTGTEANGQSTLTVTLNFSGCSTSTAVTSSVSPSTYGQSVTFTATVSSGGSAITSGSGETVTFKDGSTTLGTGTLNSSGVATFSTSTLTVSVSPHSITAVYGGDSNYGGSTSAVLVQTVNPAPLTITATNKSKVYGTTVSFAGTEFTTSGLVNSDAVTSVTLSSAGAGLTAAVTAPGSPYSITPSAAVGPGLSNYNITYVNGSLTVTAAPLTITAKNATKTYGQALAFTGTEFTSSGLLNSDTVTSVTLTSAGSAATATVAGGPYAITPSAAVGSGLGNYSITYATGSLTVTAAPLTITAKNASKTYGQTLTFAGTEFTSSGLLNSDTITSVTLTSAGTAATVTVVGGPYAITPSAAVGTGLGNYNISYVNGSLSVTAAPLTITAKNLSKTYGQSLTFAGTEFTTTGLVNSDAVSSVTLTSTGAAATAVVVGGPYAITPSAAVGAGLGNYNISYVNGSLSVTAAPLTITAKNLSKMYGQSLTFAGTEFTTTGLVNSDTVSSVTLSSPGTTATATVAGGPYAITPGAAVGTGLGNYSINYVNGALSVTPAALTITAKDATKTYGQTVTFAGTEFTTTGLVNGDTVTSVTLASAGAGATATVAGGPYPTTASSAVGTGLGNYSISYVSGSLSVSAAPLTITAKNASKTYGQTLTFAGAEFTPSGLLNGDTVSNVNLTSPGAASTAPVTGSPYVITASSAVGSGLSNYTIAYVNGSLTVNPATLTLSLTGSGGVYTASPYGAVCSVASGLVNGDSVALSIGYSSVSAPVNVGSYTATCTSSGNANYQTATAQTAIIITPATLTITAKNQSMTFGGAAPTFAADFAGLMGADTSAVVSGLSFTTYTDSGLGTPVSNYQTLKVGTYPVVPGGATAANYAIHYVNGTLTVNKATLTGSVIITPADPQTVPYGKPATATVYLNSYSIGGVDVLQAHNDPNNPNNPNNPLPPSVTLYLVPANGGPAQAFKFGTATAVPTFDNTTNTTGTTKTGWAISITGNAPVPGQYSAVVYGDDPGDNSLSSLNLADAGYFFADTADISYPTLSSNVLTVVPANLTITANSISKTYGQSITFAGTEFTTSGLVNSDTVTGVTLTSTGASAIAGVVGSPYAIVASAAVGTGLSNYTISYVDGSLTVNPAPLTITANNATKTYGQALSFAGTEFTSSGLLNGDKVSSVTLTSLGAAATAGVAGTPYAIVASAAVGTGLSNYTISYVNGSLTVNPATPTINWATPAAITYGTALSGTQLNASASYLSGGTQTTVAGTFTYTPAAGAVLNAGTQTLQVHFVPSDTTDFNSADGSITLTVNKATPTINWATPAAITYGTPLSTTQLDAAASYLNTGTQTAVAGTFTYTPAAGTVLPAGNQTLLVHFAPTDTSNFNPTDGSVSLTVNKATPAISWATPAAVTYGTPISTTQLNAATSYLNSGTQTSVAGAFTYTPAAGTVLPAGNQNLQVHFVPTDTSNFNSADGSVALLVNKATLLVTANNQSMTYGDPLQAYTYAITGFVNGDTQATAVTGAPSLTTSPVQPVNAGGYTITAAQGTLGAANYVFSFAPGTLTINKANASVTPNASTKVYGTADPTMAGTLTGFLSSDNVTATYSRTPGETVTGGPYTISAVLSPTAVLSNYNITYNTAQFTITQASASVTPNAASKVYGTADPALTGTLTGFLAGDNVTATYSRAVGETVSGGPYSITAVLSPTSVLSNYNITYHTAQFTITQASASVTPNAASKVYGTADPALTGTLTGFLAGDNVAATYSRAAGETVTGGPYSITAKLSPTAVLNNYNITYNTAPFTITPASASVTPNPASKTYSTTDPALTGTLTGFLSSDNVTATYGRTPGETVAGGPYTISAVLSPTAVLSNYNITYNTALFTITKATPVVTWNPSAVVYGAPLGSAQLNATTTIPGSWAYTPASGTVLSAGSHTLSVTFTPTDSSDYASATQTATVKAQYSLNACLGDLGHSILQPINANGTSTFKQGSTVPAKFRVCNASGNSVGTAGVVTSFYLVQMLNGTVTQSVDETVASTTPDTSFRWDPTDQQWIFNINTKGLATSTTYFYAIGLNDGSTIMFQYGLPK